MAQPKRSLLINLVFFFFLLEANTVLASQPLSNAKQDATFRATIVGKSQVEIEQALIEAKNGVFVLFTPTQGTPQMVSENGAVPEGLIPAQRLASYDTSVKPRVLTTHEMPKAGVNAVFIRHKAQRPRVDDPSLFVDETHYNALLATHPKRFVEKVIDQALFAQLKKNDVPAAFYYYVPKGKTQAEFAAIFGKQINSPVGNKLSDPGVYANRAQDLKHVNGMLISLGMTSVEALLDAQDLRNESEMGTVFHEGKRRSARLKSRL